ncbi:hypothetical protein Pint_06221 [Pistacia integerrima]|uniref:Uncharacterized protein n=1 Tax=Pistacia integerrima TaxID=434235 RepID=A0ACC0Z3Y8_9ROSI|nr:hypothetical protein Pint_06221 [Pistacia integerrima]
MIDKGAKKVLFAEAGKDFVDVLFNLLSLNIGTVIKLLRDANMVGCIGNLYPSLENLNKDYLQPNQNKLELLKTLEKTSGLLVPRASSQQQKKFYNCFSRCHIDLIQEHVKDIGALEKRVVEFGADEDYSDFLSISGPGAVGDFLAIRCSSYFYLPLEERT